jgi:hypothetical protein
MRENERKGGAKLADKTDGLVKDGGYKGRSKKHAKDFIRERKMGFQKLICFLLSMINESSQNALERFFPRIGERGVTMTQQSFSEARQKLKWEAIQEIFDYCVKNIYEGYTERWHKYRVMAIDGSKIALPSDDELKEVFGTFGGGDRAVSAQASILYDIYEHVVVDALLEPIASDERTLAMRHIDKLTKMPSFGKELIIFDRGYPSNELVKELGDKGITFLMRVRRKFNLTIDNAKRQDFRMLLGQGTKDETKVRIIKVKLDSGETETLITNLFSKRLNVSDFKELYFKRWPVETEYDELKNKMAVENFSGRTETAVRQDFYAAMYLTNLANAFWWEAQEAVDEKQKGKNNKYEYRVNVNHEIGVLKDRLVTAVLEEDDNKRRRIFDEINQLLISRIVPVRPNRKIKRKPPRNQKYYMNHKLNC